MATYRFQTGVSGRGLTPLRRTLYFIRAIITAPILVLEIPAVLGKERTKRRLTFRFMNDLCNATLGRGLDIGNRVVGYLRKNQTRLFDMEPGSGLLIGPEYSEVVERMIGDSLECLEKIDTIDMFIHDSDHSAVHEAAEFATIASRLSPHAIVVSDNAHVTDELAKWSSRTGRRFAYFAEKPVNHWYQGAGIGVADEKR